MDQTERRTTTTVILIMLILLSVSVEFRTYTLVVINLQNYYHAHEGCCPDLLYEIVLKSIKKVKVGNRLRY